MGSPWASTDAGDIQAGRGLGSLPGKRRWHPEAESPSLSKSLKILPLAGGTGARKHAQAYASGLLSSCW